MSGNGDITVWINSPGGDCVATAQLYNMLREYEGKVTVKIDGIAASAASVIAMAGDRVLMSLVLAVWSITLNLRRPTPELERFRWQRMCSECFRQFWKTDQRTFWRLWWMVMWDFFSEIRTGCRKWRCIGSIDSKMQ